MRRTWTGNAVEDKFEIGRLVDEVKVLKAEKLKAGVGELSKYIEHKLTNTETKAKRTLALCVGCARLHSMLKGDEDFGKCPHCGDNTVFSGQLSLEWIRMILKSLGRLGIDD